MVTLGFCDKWIKWIRGCLETSTISVLVNGSPTEQFSPTKGAGIDAGEQVDA